MVASRYPNQPQPLWNLPGGRQQRGELLTESVVREFHEETGLRVRVQSLAYVSESYDGERHYVNTTFLVSPFDSTQRDKSGDSSDHVVAVEWVPIAEVAARVAVGVVREPLVAYLEGRLETRYAGYHRAGITIEWPEGSA
jgi:ADP-ribose pyrophosphatase YjhB (NUDIX family)